MLQDREEQYHPVAKIIKPHGVHGELKVELSEEYPEILEHTELFWAANSDNMLVPVRIKKYRRVEDIGRYLFFVHFDGIDDRDEAEPWRHKHLLISNKARSTGTAGDDDTIDLAGFSLVNEHGSVEGAVINVLDNPAHFILVTDIDLLIPYVDEYIVEIDENEKVVRCQNIDMLKQI